MMGNLLTIYNLEASIGTSKSSETWTYAKLENGLDNVSEALNEVVQQYFFLNDKGFARNHVTGMAPTFTFTGRRVQGDDAQDYIFGNKYKLDTNRNSSFQLKVTDNSGVSPKVTPTPWTAPSAIFRSIPALPPMTAPSPLRSASTVHLRRLPPDDNKC